MTAKKLLRILQANGVTCFRLGDTWQVVEEEYDAFQDRCVAQARQSRRARRCSAIGASDVAVAAA